MASCPPFVRRAERHAVALSKRETVNPELFRYLNRPSSLLFALAVWVQPKEGATPEHPTCQR